MAFDKSSQDDYNTVAERITEFRDKYPDGSLRPVDPTKPYRIEQIGDRVFVVYIAAAYRSPTDECPGIGTAWEPFPGRTPFTRDSELQNAETAAWGRAIVATLAADAKKGIATAEDVRNRQADQDASVVFDRQWDPVEQETVLIGWQAEIADAKDLPALNVLSTKIHAERREGKLSPVVYSKLAKAGAARRAELNPVAS